jgi:hypothetical protein
MATEDLMAKLTQTGGEPSVKYIIEDNETKYIREAPAECRGKIYDSMEDAIKDGGVPPPSTGGRRRRHSKGHRGNSWLTHVKATMKLNRGKSFKQVLKLAKKSYKKSQSQSGGKRRKSRRGQDGGSGGKVTGVGASASPYV